MAWRTVLLSPTHRPTLEVFIKAQHARYQKLQQYNTSVLV